MRARDSDLFHAQRVSIVGVLRCLTIYFTSFSILLQFNVYVIQTTFHISHMMLSGIFLFLSGFRFFIVFFSHLHSSSYKHVSFITSYIKPIRYDLVHLSQCDLYDSIAKNILISFWMILSEWIENAEFSIYRSDGVGTQIYSHFFQFFKEKSLLRLSCWYAFQFDLVQILSISPQRISNATH